MVSVSAGQGGLCRDTTEREGRRQLCPVAWRGRHTQVLPWAPSEWGSEWRAGTDGHFSPAGRRAPSEWGSEWRAGTDGQILRKYWYSQILLLKILFECCLRFWGRGIWNRWSGSRDFFQAPMLLSGFGLWLEEKISLGKFQGCWTKALPYGKARESLWIWCFVGLH